jgi:hypothetical protein
MIENRILLGDNEEPLNTITSRGAGALVEPLLVEYHGTNKPYPVSLLDAQEP